MAGDAPKLLLMALRRTHLELSVERPLGRGADPSEGIVRISSRFEVIGEEPSIEELQRALDRLRTELGQLTVYTSRADRTLDELVETYHPRQVELLDLLKDEGEITPVEFDRLKAHLAGGASPVAVAAPPPHPSPSTARGGPLERPGGAARNVEALLRDFRIENLRQAGVVRARREISFDEYMALKRHFEAPAPST